MKIKIFIILLIAFSTASIFAQSPQKFKYQAVARDANGNPISNDSIGVQVNILDGVNPFFAEQHINVPVNQFGLFTLEIGSKTPLLDSFTSINWATGNKYIKLYFDFNGGTNYTLFGSPVPLLSVPYALYSETSGTPSNDADADSTNELQTISKAGNTITLSNGGGSVTDSDNQMLTLNGNNLSISGGDTVVLPTGSGTVTQVNTGTGLTGGPITTTGTISLDTTGVAAGTYGASNQIPQITVNPQGQITSIGVASVPVSNYQNLNISGDTLSITEGNSIVLSDNDNQILNISGDTLAISNGNSVLLPQSTDNQTLNIFSDTISISNGNAIVLPQDNDNQILNITGDTLAISSGNSVLLPQNDWSLAGNTGTTSGTNFIGTTDAQALDIRTNDTLKVRITTKGQIETYNTGESVFIGKAAGANDDLTANKNVFIGDSAGFANTSGYYNVSTGYNSMRFNSTGFQNTAVGHLSLTKNSTGNYNTAFGERALSENTTGNKNTAIGCRALANTNTTGDENTAIGYLSLLNNTTGSDNVGIGYRALLSNDVGYRNVAIGNTALYGNSSGNYNVAIGYEAMVYNLGATSGSYNTAVGYGVMRFITTGSYNTAIGRFAIADNTTGTYITGIGNSAWIDAGNRSNVIVLAGNGNLSPNGDNRVRIGNSSMSSIGGQVGWTTISDERLKENFKDDIQGLSFIMKLKPVTYNYSIEKSNRLQNRIDTTDWTGKYDIEKIKFSGFRAQEVEKAAQETGFSFSGVDKPENVNGLWGLRYAEFVVPMVKAMQEQQELINDLKNQIEILKKELEEIKK